MTRTGGAALLLCLGLWSMPRPVIAQSSGLVPQNPTLHQNREPDQQDKNIADMERRRDKQMNKQRQQDLKRDTDRLLQLATELKLYVDKSNENTLSLSVIKKADEIQKLAKAVKEKMKGGY